MIIEELQRWRKEDPTNIPIPPEISQIIKNQRKIGWYSFLMGFIDLEWKAIQQRYLETLQKRTMGKCWATTLIQKLFKVSWDMWEHRNAIKFGPSNPKTI